jgi:hypothetical protein
MRAHRQRLKGVALHPSVVIRGPAGGTGAEHTTLVRSRPLMSSARERVTPVLE